MVLNEKMTAQLNDQRLMELAKYKATEGLLKDATDSDVLKQFTLMKKRVLKGSVTVTKLEETVYGKLGVQEKIKMPKPQLGFHDGSAPSQEIPLAKKEEEKEIIGFTPGDE